MFIHFIGIWCLTIMTFWTTAGVSFNREHVIVWFDPYVSRSDKDQGGKYNARDIVPMIQKISTRFSKIMIGSVLLNSDSNDKTVEAIPYATALVNVAQHKNDQPPLEVYMSFTSANQNRNLELERIHQLADKANAKFNGTVRRLIFDFLKLSNAENVLRELKYAKKYLANGTYPYKFGVVIEDEVCLKTSEDFPNYLIPILAYVDVVFFDIRVYSGHTVTGPYQEFERIRRIFGRCKNAVSSLKPEVEVGFQTGWLRDENRNGRDLDSQLAEYWRINNEWATKTNTTVCLFEAFDNPYKSWQWARLGIWELVEDNKYINSSEYIFQDKIQLIGIEDDIDVIPESTFENKSVTFLHNITITKNSNKESANFSRQHVIVWFEPYVATADINDPGSYTMIDIVPMVQKISTKFSKIMIKSIMLSNVIDKSIEAIPYSTAVVNAQYVKDQPPMEVYMTFGLSPNGTNFEFEEIVQLANIANAKSTGTVSNFVFEYVTQTNADAALYQIRIAKNILERNGNQKYKLGLNVFDEDNCLSTSVNFPGYLIPLLQYVDMVYFDVQVTTKRSPLTEFKRVRKIFLRCKQAILKLKPEVDVGFQTGWLKDYEIYEGPNPSDRDYDSELVAYWQLVNDWAARNNTTVIFYEAMDNPYKDSEWKNTGFWKLDESVLYANSSEYVFLEKIGPSLETTLYYSKFKTPEIHSSTSLVKNSETTVTFNREYVVVWFEPYVSEADVTDAGSYQRVDIIPMINLMETKFSKIIVDSIMLNEDSIDKSIAIIPYATAVTNKKNANFTKFPMEVIVTFSSSDESTAKFEFEKVLANAEAANGKFNGTVQSIIYTNPLTTYNIKEVTKTLKTAKELIKTVNDSYNLGVVVDDEYCNEESLLYPGNIAKVLVHVDLIIVNVETWNDNTVRGPTSEFERVIQIFSKCKSTIRKVNSRIAVGLQTAWTKGENPRNADYELQLVNYWNLTGNWAQNTHTVVYLQYAFDIPYKNYKWRETGIWRLDENYLYDNSSQYLFVDKIKEIENRENELKFRTLDYPRNNNNKVRYNTTHILMLGVIFLIVLFVISVGGLILNKFVTWKVNSNQLTSYELEEFFDGGEISEEGCKIEEIFGLAYNSDLELAKEMFFFDYDSILGSGAFGVVYYGWVEKPNEFRRNIAIKTTKQPCPSTALKGLLSEIKVLSYLGTHQNIVNIIGAYTQELRQGKLYVFTELCALGSLQNYLRANHEQTSYTVLYCSSETLGEGHNECPATNFLKWSTQIATGLEFMAAKQVVHADIATRNILLTADKTAKISDFGLSRRLYDYETYVKKQQEPLPWRWMAPEALRLHEFNEKTDVWSFGITLWEIYTFGSVPYPGLSWTSGFALSLEQGLRVEQTPTCTDEIYTVILECCQTHPNSRPTFSELKEALETL